MAKVTPIKRMTAAEAHRERTRLRVSVGSLCLARMTAPDTVEIDARLVKLRRRIARLDRRIRIASAPVVAPAELVTAGEGVGAAA